MTIALVKEDGTLVAGANTYVSVGDLTTFATLRGVTLPTNTDTTSIALVQAMDLIADYAERFVGERITALQALDWPRTCYWDTSVPQLTGAICPGNGINALTAAVTSIPVTPAFVMPQALINAQCQAALAALAGNTLQPVVGVTGFVSVDKIGPLQTEYEKGVDFSNQPILPAFRTAILSICRRQAFLAVGRS